MRTLCITLPEKPLKTEAAKKHFEEAGLTNVEYMFGINAEVAGLQAEHPYNVDRTPAEGDFHMGYHPTGVFLSHYMAWSAIKHMPDAHVLILEDDAKFEEGWKLKFEKAMQDVPADFDFLFIGSCCCNGKRTRLVKGDVYKVDYPACLHAYVIAKKCIDKVLLTQRDVYGPIDLTLTFHTFPHLKVYTVLPRLASQFNTEIPV